VHRLGVVEEIPDGLDEALWLLMVGEVARLLEYDESAGGHSPMGVVGVADGDDAVTLAPHDEGGQ
jgi:hypothetical protein